MKLWKWNKRFKVSALWMLLIFMLWITGCTRGGKIDAPQPSAVSSTEVSEEVASVEAATEASTVYASTEQSTESVTLSSDTGDADSNDTLMDEDEAYTSKDDVARYISLYGKLPSNFITKKEAQKLGWPGGSLEKYAPGKCIGGDRFGNYEGLLPNKKGRKYFECDIDTLGKSKRGAKRIIYSNDGLIYYTGDHYESFELLYGEP
jgi:guanyl-specific ribonuclease Sa